MKKKLNMPTIIFCGALLLFCHTRKDNETNKKLDHITEYVIKHEKSNRLEKIQKKTIKLQKETIDSLLLDQMDLGAKLDSCIIVND